MNKVTPEWISQEELRKRCNISDFTEYQWVNKYNLHYSKMGDKRFYDWNQVTKIMTENSTYKFLKTA